MLSNTLSRALTLAAAAALTLSLAACSPATEPADTPRPSAPAATEETTSDGECTGVTVIVDTGELDVAEDPSGTTCVGADAAIRGSDAIAEAGLTTVGTKTYPEDVVCRVNGVPAEDTELPAADGSAYFETCADMPPATAYWSLWVQPAGGEWGYAPTSLPGLQLNPGDSVQLLFTLNGAPAEPTS